MERVKMSQNESIVVYTAINSAFILKYMANAL